ncbi:amidohydrolase family protein [Meridianimarinicoccus aquatilis]|uniref:amidohydrolase family protein n=1 Tax=Meridianimarinicoccus aquatilis TaxID=2552766 RepID=UPI0014055D1D|nr:amidohydrolase family protein [Fluviibacterium aquatile]
MGGNKQAIDAGVRSIEHGNLIDEEIAQMMVENGMWLSPQVLVYRAFSADLRPARPEKGRLVEAGLGDMFSLAKECGIKSVFGTDVVVNPRACADQNKEFAARLDWVTPAKILTRATANSGEVLQLSGYRSPYPGVVGRIVEGAHADLLLTNGNSVEDFTILEDYDAAIAFIMKAGVINRENM